MNDIQTDIPSHRIAFDIPAFDEAIRSQGVRLVHYHAMRCPVGMVDLDDNRRSHPDHAGCTNGFIYTKVGVVTGLFMGNSKSKRTDDLGFWDGSTVQVTLPRMYDESEEEVSVAPFDRFYLDEARISVNTWQTYMHHESGVDRLKYPAIKVDRLMDSSGLSYSEGSDFTLNSSGQLVWGSKRPTPDLSVGGDTHSTRGAVCGVRYRYRPYWYVGQIVHEIRVTQAPDEMGERVTHRMPQAVVLHREYVVTTNPQNTAGDPGEGPASADAFRTMMGSAMGGFGPR